MKGPDLHEIWDDAVVRSNYRLGSDRLQYIGWMTNVEVTGGAKKLGRRLAVPKEWPFMVANSAGEGRSLYFAADIAQAYFTAPYQYQRKLISNSVKWAAGKNGQLVELDAPLCVQSAFYTQNDGVRWVVHLLNEINTSANRAIPENNPSQREEVVPIADIKVRVRGVNMASAFFEPGHHELQIRKNDQWQEVIVPRLDVHGMMVFEQPH